MAVLDTKYTYYYYSGTNSPSGGGDARWYFKIELVSQDIEANTSYIKITPYTQIANYTLYGMDQANSSSVKAKINGTYSSTNYKNIFGLYSGSYSHTALYYTINHNVDGTGSFTFLGTGGIRPTGDTYYYYFNTSAVTITLPNIPRYAVINSFNATVDSPTSVSVAWSTDSTCDLIEYSTNNGTSYSTASGQSGTSGTFAITGLSVETAYNIKLRVRRTDSQLKTESSALSRTTWVLSTSVFANFNLGTNVTITVTRANSTITHDIGVYAKNPDSSTYTLIKTLTAVETSTTLSFTSGELDTIYALIPTKLYADIRLTTATKIGSTSYGTTNSTVQTGTVVSANPTFTTFTYADQDSAMVTLTGSNQKIVKGYSNPRAIITTTNKAVAVKGATMSYYRFVCGAKETTATYSGVATVNLDLANVDNNVFTVYAVDSRGNSTSKVINASTYLEYFAVTKGTATAVRTNDIGEPVTITFNGTAWHDTFGSTANALTVTYRYKKTTSSTWITGTSSISSLTWTGSNYSRSQTIIGDTATGFNVLYSYNIEIIVADKITTVTHTILLGSGTPNIAISQNGVAINQAYDETLGGALQVNGEIKSTVGFFSELKWGFAKNSTGAGWWKIATISTGGATGKYKIEAYSNVTALSGRGDFELIVSFGTNNEYCFVNTGTTGLNTSYFDYRLVATNTYEVWFYIPQYTYYTAYATRVKSDTSSTFTGNNEAGTPSGTAITIDSTSYRIGIAISDLDNATTNGCYLLAGGSNGPPGVTYATVWVINSNDLTKPATGGYCNQFCYNAGYPYDIYYRRKIDANAWSTWIEQLTGTNIIDNLTSTSTTDVLSANQGGVLKTEIDTKLTQAGTIATTLNDDTAASVTPHSQFGIIFVSPRGSGYAEIVGVAVYRCASTGVFRKTIFAGANFVMTTGALTGTTGTDGKFTCACHSDGKIYFENRTGGAVSFCYITMGS